MGNLDGEVAVWGSAVDEPHWGGQGGEKIGREDWPRDKSLSFRAVHVAFTVYAARRFSNGSKRESSIDVLGYDVKGAIRK